jgi:hypothetical protein
MVRPIRMPWHISIQIQGPEFRPSQVHFRFTEQQDPGVIGKFGRYRGQPVPYGSADFVVPSSVSRAQGITYLVHTIEPVLDAIRAAGATDWHISIDRYYHAQCNEEYSLEELKLIARLGCGFIYSAHEVSEAKEREMERKFEENSHVV